MIQAEVIIRGDLLRTLPPSTQGEKAGNAVAVAIGRYCFFSRGCELRPPGKIYRGFVIFSHCSSIFRPCGYLEKCANRFGTIELSHTFPSKSATMST